MYIPIVPTKEYNPREIAKNGWIVNTRGKKDHRYILSLIKRQQLRARNVCLTGKTYWKVLGTDILKYKNSGYNIPEQPDNENASSQITHQTQSGVYPQNR